MAIGLSGTAVLDSGVSETAPPVNVPTGTARKIIYFVCVPSVGAQPIDSVSSGWSVVAEAAYEPIGAKTRIALIASDADTSDTTCTVTVTSANPGSWCSIASAIVDWSGNLVSGHVEDSKDPPNVTLPWGASVPSLIIPAYGHEDGRKTPSGYPETGNNELSNEPGASGCTGAWCTVGVSAASYDPGVYTEGGAVNAMVSTFGLQETVTPTSLPIFRNPLRGLVQR